MFEKKRGKRFLASVMALVMLLSLAPVSALAAKDNSECTTEDTLEIQNVETYYELSGESNNNFTEARYIWEKDNTVYLAFTVSNGNGNGAGNSKPIQSATASEKSLNVDHTLYKYLKFGSKDSILAEGKNEQDTRWQIATCTGSIQNLLNTGNTLTISADTGPGGYNLTNASYTVENYPTQKPDPEPEPEPNSTDVYVYFKIVDANGNVVDTTKFNNADLQKVEYNSNEAKCWATLGKISVAGTIADGTYGTGTTEIPQNVITAATTQLTGNALWKDNKDIALTVLAHIQWTKLAQHNGAEDYKDSGTNYWHLDGQITGYKVTYATGAGNETVTGMPYDTQSYTDGMYYLSGSQYTVSNATPQRTGYTFAGWKSDDTETVYTTEGSMTFTMPAEDVTLTAVWEEKETDPNPPTDTTKNAKYFVLMPSKGKPTSGQNQGPRNYFPNATDNGGVKYGSLTGYKGKIYTSIIQDHPEANTKDGYFVANGIDSKYLVVPSNLGYFNAGYTGEFPSVLGDNFTMTGKKIIWYVVKNVVTDLTPSYHVDGYLAGIPVELRYHENFNFISGIDDTIDTVNKNGENDLCSGDTVTISGIDETTTAKHPGWTFVKWTENRDGSGTSYNANDPKVMMDSCDLYAQWKQTAPPETDTYALKINYVYENGTQAAEPYTAQLNQNEKYKVDSPPISGYVASMATVEGKMSAGSKEVTVTYYLDSWKDADRTDEEKDEDAETGGDGIPDCQQVKIVYEAFEQSNGTVTPTIEIATIENGKLNKVNGSTATANTGFAFATWTDVDVEVTNDNVNSLATKLGNKTCTPNIATPTGNTTYTYTAIFLKDEVGGTSEKEGADTPDNIPDAWQYKVTFKVSNGKWDNGTTADVVAYVTNKKDDIPCAKGTEGSKATLNGVTIPPVGNQPNSGYTSSGSWNTPLSTDLEIKEDTVFTYTYDQKSGGGSGGGGGGSRPTVTIPDNVPTGLNGKDHYAYIIGYGNNDVRPQNNITRAEVATIFFRLLTDETREANMTKSNSYNDVKDGDWFCCAVSTLSKMGIIKGYEDGSFKPNDPISRAEFAAIAARFDPDGDKTPASFSDVTSHWAKDEISIAANHGWIKGYEDGSFKPDQKITRAETMTLVNRVLNRLPETKDDLHKDMKTWVDNMDETAWYYLAVQEATNSHYFKNKTSTKFEQWTDLRDTRDWSELEK